MNRPRKKLSVWLMLIACAGIGAGGCAGPGKPPTPPQPIPPVFDPARAEQWYRGWERQRDVPSNDVRDMVFFMGSRDRDWRNPVGPDGYAIRVILIGPEGDPQEVEGSFRVFLVKNPAEPGARATHAWLVPPEDIPRRFRAEGLWSGYVLQLDWGDGPAEPEQNYMLVVRWVSENEMHWITRNVQFPEEIVTHEVSVTSRPTSRPAAAGN